MCVCVCVRVRLRVRVRVCVTAIRVTAVTAVTAAIVATAGGVRRVLVARKYQICRCPPLTGHTVFLMLVEALRGLKVATGEKHFGMLLQGFETCVHDRTRHIKILLVLISVSQIFYTELLL